ncbi:hypothetical protein [Pseudomonas nitroreducens]|uniref:hypothetical protein n=1 Tax=Pseudomonas nitroreducens TaxID=46680 RepID=UPI001C868A8D|nr:hypothetical protein [Pseudomonas nitritireducens]
MATIDAVWVRENIRLATMPARPEWPSPEELLFPVNVGSIGHREWRINPLISSITAWLRGL